MAENGGASFVIFSSSHIMAIAALCLLVFLLFISRKSWSPQPKTQYIERLFALSLLVMDVCYYVWLFWTERWNVSDSLPLELCSISLILSIILLWTGNKHLYDFVFFAGIGGALQAMATPVLDMDFPHFRYFHFFYTHIGIILTALYFTWIKGFRPSFRGIMKTMVILNLLLPLIFATNIVFNGNYMFLREKPVNGSLLDFLGPYPWYILSLEGAAFFIFICLWLLFKSMEGPLTKSSYSGKGEGL